MDLATRFPTAYIILFLLIILVAAVTWIIPAGQCERSMTEEVGREVAVPGTYQTVDPTPQGFVDAHQILSIDGLFLYLFWIFSA